MKRFWVSWISPQDDYRPMAIPVPPAVKGYWHSGYDADDHPIVCALVQAKDEAAARKSLASKKCWPETRKIDFRFFEEKPADWVPGDRFPMESK